MGGFVSKVFKATGLSKVVSAISGKKKQSIPKPLAYQAIKKVDSTLSARRGKERNNTVKTSSADCIYAHMQTLNDFILRFWHYALQLFDDFIQNLAYALSLNIFRPYKISRCAG